jgi:hypothetical protein
MNNISFGFQGGGSGTTPIPPPTSITETFAIGSGLVLNGNTVALANAPTGMQMVFWDGVTTVQGTQWSLAGNIITFTSFTFQSDTVVQVQYQY